MSLPSIYLEGQDLQYQFSYRLFLRIGRDVTSLEAPAYFALVHGFGSLATYPKRNEKASS